MGKGRFPLRQTNLSVVFSIVQNHFKNQLKGKSIDRQIACFFRQFCSLNKINRCLSDPYDSNVHQRYLLRVVFLKVILPLEVLRSLHLAPPKGVDFDRWVCFASPCSSGDRFKSQSVKVIEQIRLALKHQDGLPSNYYKTFKKTWGSLSRSKPIDCSKKSVFGTHSPLILFPVKDLPKRVKLEIIRNYGQEKDFALALDGLFVCPDHFGSAPGSNLELKLRSDSIFNYSLEYITEILRDGTGVFRRGRKGWKSLPYLPTLISRFKLQPWFDSPKPVTDTTLSVIESSLRMACEDYENYFGMGSNSSQFDGGYASS